MKNKIQERIKEAQKFAKENHIKSMKKMGRYSKTFSDSRKWREVKSLPDKDKRYFALTGTPDKAFVIADLKTGEVKAYNQAKDLIKTFK